jgi:hypothetical protein
MQTVHQMPYPVLLGVHEGDWWDASQIYRRYEKKKKKRGLCSSANSSYFFPLCSWALSNAKWTAQGPLINRTDVPKWLLNTPLWVNTGWDWGSLNWTAGDPDVVIEKLATVRQIFNVTPIAAHWYCWHNIPFDTGSLAPFFLHFLTFKNNRLP